MYLDTITDEMPVANVANRFIRPGTSSKENLILAKFSKENEITSCLDEDSVGYDGFG
jgi:hypothetical protein